MRIRSQILTVIVDIVTNMVLGILGLRLILKLFGASTEAPFVRWVYETTQPLLTPFLGMFPSPKIEGGFVIEFSVIFALIVYLFISYVILEVVESLVGIEERHHKHKD